MLERINPPGLHRPPTYTQVTVGRGNRLIFVSGQVGVDAQGELVAPDLEAQARQAYANVRTALAAAGAGAPDVAKLTTLVVGYRQELLAVVTAARQEVLGDHLPASTLVGVAGLARPEYLIEVEAMAVLA
jgi:enamine deaminase RidA (YjgF/YER057c/UK114 family)